MGLSEMIRTLLIAVSLGLAAAQDTYSCPDGWEKEEDRSGCRCFLIGETEAVKRSTADLICAGHSGSWVAELDHPGIALVLVLVLVVVPVLVLSTSTSTSTSTRTSTSTGTGTSTSTSASTSTSTSPSTSTSTRATIGTST